ncbi:MAG: hypothetical protein PHF16_02425 [Atribacterota bacterium]|nr:hypothetical protein [Atribacterota bacterium]
MRILKEFFDFNALSGSKKLKDILNSNNREHDLKEYAKEIGAISPLPMSNIRGQEENEIIKQIQNTHRSKREESLWKFAFLSAIVSIISTIIALVAVINN